MKVLITSLQCNHTFHTECIDRCLENNTICPICRRSTIHNDNLRIDEIYSNIVILDQTITIWTEIFYTINGQRHYFYVDIKEKITKDATNSLLHKLESLFTTLLNPNTFNLNEENNARLATVIINSMRQYINQFNDAIESKAPYLDNIRSVKKITSISLGILTAAISLVLLNKYPSENYYNFLSNYTMY